MPRCGLSISFLTSIIWVMVQKKIINIRKWTALIGVAVVTALTIVYLLSPILFGRLATAHLRSVFAEQSKLMSGPIASLGVTGEPSTRFQCLDEQHTHWQTEVICQNFAVYNYNESPISAAAKNNYPSNAAKFDQLLKENGWVNDRPQDPVTTLAGSNPYSPQNAGQGGSVPFHKNIGSISCNLKINFNPLNDPNNPAAPGAINVNEFSCSQNIRFFMPHFTNWQAQGP